MSLDKFHVKQYLVGAIFLIVSNACSRIDHKPKYQDFSNDWERHNLIGKVKSIELSKAFIIDSKSGETDDVFLVSKIAFTDFGKIIEEKHFERFGDIAHLITNKYDSNGNRIETISESAGGQFISKEKLKYDQNGNQIFLHTIVNDSMHFKTYFDKYDSLGNALLLRIEEDSMTGIVNFQYEYNSQGKMLSKKQVASNPEGEYYQTHRFNYNEDGDLVERILESESLGQQRTTFVYDSHHRVIKIIQHVLGQIESERMFDELYNLKEERVFENGKLIKEFKYELEFDRRGNWVERKVFVGSKNSEKMELSHIESRKLIYFD